MTVRNDNTLVLSEFDEYSYDELTLTKDNRIKYELLTPSLSTISLTCKGIKVDKG